ncbi:nucleoside/nucleotide kinase family protein [Ovoidimarina sediminis]|uniref:nucleoside/nucleotide kinase family protein n=1 Tax=Ovoidimarina sediminis TaxID=3079856 RepID=UPI0029101ADA|nr:nucleoside/nucleotide kinase family protein [Rhodophyticola sp. MJ-SS7]MDU8942745.1 nucleoside/nucleotide kinase family protein [Rhodophyticola sp. MJ-SS7]
MDGDAFFAAVRDWARRIPDGERRVLAIAGAPGSGKSTLAEHLVERLDPGLAAILPMDGYHFDDRVLDPRGHRAVKGAPHTFDVGGFRVMLARLRANDEPEVAVPVFDRDLEVARAAARIIPASVRLIVAEGNYLLLDRAPWTDLLPLYDRTAYLDVPLEELERRLRARWEGYSMTPGDIAAKLEGNDLPNARTVVTERRAADWVVTWQGAPDPAR